MPRRRMPWFKVHTSILNSSFNYEFSLQEQATWLKLLALAADLGGTGFINDGEGQPIPHDFIANRIHVPVEVLESTIKKGKVTNRLRENSTGLEIIKWKEYQSEYNRQKPYREAKKERDNSEMIRISIIGRISREKSKKNGHKVEGKELQDIVDFVDKELEFGTGQEEIIKKYFKGKS